MLRRRLLATILLATILGTAAAQPAGHTDFAFLQVSDLHVGPYLARSGEPGPVRGAETITWFCTEAARPQALEPFDLTTPVPAFALATGDLTEYGVIDETWPQFERAFAGLPCPLYVVPGNHDNTWGAMYHVLRQRHGGENYAFDHAGCHFVCLSSASPQEPVPTLDAKTRAWLKADLARLAPDTPVFLALHHPPYSTEFASPVEYDTFIDLLRDYNVVLLLYGHGHGVDHRRMDGFDGVMGGSTFGKNAGYAVVSVQDGILRVAYRYHQPESGKPAWQKLLEKPLPTAAVPRLFSITAPIEGAAIDGREMEVALAVPTGTELKTDNVKLTLDGEPATATPITTASQPTWRVAVGDLQPGWHLLTVRAAAGKGAMDVRCVTFRVGATERERWRRSFPAAIKAGPVLIDDQVIVARTDGVVTALARDTGRDVWSFSAGAEILGTPAWTGTRLVFGAGDGRVYALDRQGQQVRTYEAGLPVYGWPLIDGDVVYIGDNGGRLHALGLDDGRKHWVFERADFAIEAQPARWGSHIVFGAWDGYLYGVAADSGALAFKVWGPKSSAGGAARYYAPADCGPLAIGDTLFVADRGYVLGQYGPDGTPGAQLDERIAAIAAGRGGFYGRGIDNRLCRYNAEGEKSWEQPVPAGRFPIPPTCHGDAVYVCSNTGLLSVLAADDGAIRRQYQVTPGFFVMAPVTVDEAGVCYVAGMDGTVTAVRP